MTVPKRTARLGWLGPAIFALGAAVAIVAVVYMVRVKPVAGAIVHTVAVDASRSFVVRAEEGGDRNFVELHRDGKLVWQSLVPTYAGRPDAPGIAWNDVAVSVRIVRDRRAEIFALSATLGSKLGGFGLAPKHGDVVVQTSGPVTLTDHVRSYEFVEGAGWHELVAFDLTKGEPLWSVELGAAAVTDGKVDGGVVVVVQGGVTRRFDAATGAELKT